MFAELAQRSLDGQFQADFPLEGRFVTVPVKGREYWYFDLPTPEGDKRRYVGPHSDEEITARVNAHKEIKDDLRERRRMVGTLLRSGGMQGPDNFAGDITKALAGAGLFRLRAVLIGSVAFGCYAGLLGVRLPSTAMQTGDADFAQDFAISSEVGDSLPPVLEILQSIDKTFRAVPHQADKAKVAAFVNSKGYRVEFLTGNRGSDEHTGKPSPMPALGGASAENLRFLDYLIYEPVRTVLLHREGVSVIVPALPNGMPSTSSSWLPGGLPTGSGGQSATRISCKPRCSSRLCWRRDRVMRWPMPTVRHGIEARHGRRVSFPDWR